MPTLFHTPRFLKALEVIRRDEALGRRVRTALERFEADIHHPGLNFEKLRGSDFHSLRVTRGVRVILSQDGPDAFVLVDVGGHDIYRRYG